MPGRREPDACEADADARLLTDRWRDDAPGQAVDLNDDANLYSFYLRSRFDFTDAGGAEQVCDDMRAGCSTMAPDGGPVPYSFVGDAYDLRGGSSGEACALPQQGTDARDTPTDPSADRRRRRDPRREGQRPPARRRRQTTASTARRTATA